MSLPEPDTEWKAVSTSHAVADPLLLRPPHLPDPAWGLVAGDAGAVDGVAADPRGGT